jgi:hypothetical protein
MPIRKLKKIKRFEMNVAYQLPISADDINLLCETLDTVKKTQSFVRG